MWIYEGKFGYILHHKLGLAQISYLSTRVCCLLKWVRQISQSYNKTVLWSLSSLQTAFCQMKIYLRGVSVTSFPGSSPSRGWEQEDTGKEIKVSPYSLSIRLFFKIQPEDFLIYKNQLLTSAFDFTALFADKVVSISEAAQRAERLARFASSIVVKWLVGTRNHAWCDSVTNWIPDLFANVVSLERNWKKKQRNDW